MTTQCSVRPAVSLQQLAREKAFRRWSNLSLGREMLIAVGLLAVVGLVLSIGSSALDLIALR
jgi:hypothetical protein